jgi:TonB-linked SusC/RagA family outer membrane protein
MQKTDNFGKSAKKFKRFFIQRHKSTVMQCITLLMCLLLTTVYGYAQQKHFDVNWKQKPLTDALKELEQHDQYKMLFDYDDLKGYTLDLVRHNTTVREVLDAALSPLPFTWRIDGNYVTVKKNANQPDNQLVEISGCVVTPDGKPLQGVSVIIKGTTRGTVTDEAGTFKLKVLQGQMLQFSFVGMRQEEIRIESAKPVNLTMREEAAKVKDVVFTGYMTIDKSRYVGAISTVNVNDIKVVGECSIDQMLQGTVPGMAVRISSGQVGSTPKVRVRGTSTLLGNKEPLWVVDGVIQRDPQTLDDYESSLSGDIEDMRLIASNAISWLNTNDIATLTVLKDASATAIYGSKAANGVIVITTKKGTVGRLSVNYSGSITVGQKPSYGLYDRMNSQQMMQFAREMYEERVSYRASVLPIGYVKLIDGLNNKTLSYNEMVAQYRKMESQNTDWFGELFRNSFSQQHSVSINGGSDRFTNRTSINFNDSRGEAIGNDMVQYTINSNTTVRLDDRLRANIMFSGSTRRVKGFAYGVNPFDYAYSTSRVIPMYEDNGEYYYHEKWGTSSTAIASKYSYNYNILNEIEQTGNLNNSNTLSSTVDLRWSIMQGLEFQGLASYQHSSAEVKSWATEQSFYITQLRGYEFGSVQANSTEESRSQLPWGGLLYTENNSTRSMTLRGSLIWDRSFKGNHRVTVQAGIESTSNKVSGNNNTRYGYLLSRGETFASIPYSYYTTYSPTNAYENPLYETMRAATRVINRTNNYLSEYLSGVYAFDGRYIFNFNARLDASNRFGQDEDKKFRPTWSVGAKWRLGSEQFMRRVDWLNSLDISASYGFQGNAVESVSPYLIATDGGFSSKLRQYTLLIKSLPYNDLGWEKTRSWNFGIDMSLLESRLNLIADIFGKRSNVLSSRDIPAENGSLNSIVFGSIMENSGYELLLNVVPIRTEEFTWQFSVNTGKTRNRLKNNERINTLSDYLSGAAIVNGRPYSTFYSYEFDGLSSENGTPLFKNMDIEQTAYYLAFLTESGHYDPDFTGGFTSSFKYKNLRLSAAFSMQFGGRSRLPELYQNTTGVQRGLPTPEQNISSNLVNRWKQSGDELLTNIPSLPGLGDIEITLPTTDGGVRYQNPYTLYNYSDLRVADTDMIRCRQISLFFDCGRGVLNRINAKSMNIGMSIANPFMLVFDKSWEGIDPETGGWPARRTTSLSLNITF